MATIREILDIETNGKNTIKEDKNINEIVECIDDYSGLFVGSKRMEKLLENETGSYVAPLKKAMNTLKVYENRVLDEETFSKSSARILVYDVQKYLKESYDALTAKKRAFREMNKENIAKIYSTALFELNVICKKNDIILENIIDDEEFRESVSDDMAVIVSEVL